jgi:GNAT superfamily N-acetyltransferase
MSAEVHIQSVGPEAMDALVHVDPRLAEPGRRAHVGELLALGLSWLALANGEPVGFAIVSRHFFAFPFVDLLVVNEAERRGGIGSALMAHCAASHDADRIFTSTNESNAPMRALLAKAGWTPSGQVDNLDPGDPELFFVKWG